MLVSQKIIKPYLNRFDEDLSAVSMLVQLCHHSVQSDGVAAANGGENLTDI